MIGIAGGDDVFSENAAKQSAKDRIIADPLEIVRRAPDIIIGSWCGKKFRPEKVAARLGWADVPAVANAQLHEIKSAVILNPGPVAIREGLPALVRIFAQWAESA
jgi:iron complex transport system substrate-binding protein